MKHSYPKWIVAAALALALVLALGAVSMAEGETGTAAPEAEASETGSAPGATTEEEAAALKEALEAYRKAKDAKQAEALESELEAYVTEGSLTREQADLILRYRAERRQRAKSANGRLKGGDAEQDADDPQNPGPKSSGRRSPKAGSGTGRPSFGRGGSGRGSTGGRNGFGRGSDTDADTRATPEAAPALPGGDSPAMQG